MKKKGGIRLLASVLIFSLMVTGMPGTAVASDQDMDISLTSTIKNAGYTLSGLEQSYRCVREMYRLPAYSGEVITFPAAEVLLGDGDIVENAAGSTACAIHITQKNDVTVDLEVPQDGLYGLRLRYYDATENILPVVLAIQVDGAYPFYEMRNQQYLSHWIYEEAEFPLDRYGNQIVPQSQKKHQWEESQLWDVSGLINGELYLELTKGSHTLTFQCSQSEMLLQSISLTPVQEVQYADTGRPSGNSFYVYEAEAFAWKNDSAIRPAGEYNPDLSPYSSSKSVLNVLDGESFGTGGQSVTYEIKVDKDGYYAIAFRYRQNYKADFPVFREVLVDGQIPAQEFEMVKFPYNDSFINRTVTYENGEPVGVWLTAGTHTLTLRVSLENLSDEVAEVQALISQIQALSLQVDKITGNNTEKYRDFELEEYIPNLQETLLGWADRIEALYNGLVETAGDKKRVGDFAILEICQTQLRSFAEEPNELPRHMDELFQGECSVAQYLANTLEKLQTSPLELDRIFVYQEDAKLPGRTNFFVRLWEAIKRFFYSFTDEAYSMTAKNDETHLQVWAGYSRQYIEIIQKMVDEAYDRGELPIPVDISLMNDAGKLVLANAAGDTPDAALGVGYGQAFNLAIRGVLQDLNAFEDAQTVQTRFQPGIVYAGRYEDGLYALPETTNFYVLFYRKDILDNLGLEVPNTMQEVKEILPQLNRYGMNFFTHVAGYIGYKPFAATLPFIYQNGGSFYGDTAQQINLGSDETIDAIIEMTELFTVYGVPFEVRNFYQHFRSGTIPIGVADFNTYNLLLNTAPEIANSWDIALYPGYEDASGEVQRWTTGAGGCGIVFDNTGKTEESWEFLKWWTDADTQLEFALTLQSTYGQEYLWATANLEAFSMLPWNEQHKKVIMEQLNWIIEVPQVPSNYMLERKLSNALLSIVLDGENTRPAITEAVRDVRSETVRKLEEFGYIQDGETIRDYIIPKRPE